MGRHDDGKLHASINPPEGAAGTSTNVRRKNPRAKTLRTPEAKKRKRSGKCIRGRAREKKRLGRERQQDENGTGAKMGATGLKAQIGDREKEGETAAGTCKKNGSNKKTKCK